MWGAKLVYIEESKAKIEKNAENEKYQNSINVLLQL